MKEFNIRVNRTEKKCGPRRTRMTRHGWDTSIHIGATITSREGRDGLDIHSCCALPIPGKYHEYATTSHYEPCSQLVGSRAMLTTC